MFSNRSNLKISMMNEEFDITKNIFRCRSPPSLERIALTKIAISLWQQLGIRNEIIHSLDPNIFTDYIMHLHRIWKPKIEKKVLEQISYLPLPKCWTEILEGTVKAIGGQILAFLTSPDPLDVPFYEKVKIYFDNICWTMSGTVNILKTASLLVDNANISTKEKYILACNTCMDDKIKDLLRMLPENCINDFKDEIKFRLVLFWSFRIRGEDKKFMEIICQGIIFGFSANKYILRWAIENKNEVAVQYILENLSDSDLKEKVVDFAEGALRWPALMDTTFYLFSQMNQTQIEEVCIRKGYILLVSLIHNWRWHDFLVPVAMYIFKFIDKMKFWDALELFLFCWEEYILQREQYKWILKEFLTNFAHDIKRNFKEICEKILVPILFIGDVEIIKLFVCNGTLHDRKKLLYDDIGKKLCFELITARNYDILSIFINEMLTSVNEINQYKEFFFETQSFKVCFHLIVQEKYDILDEFLIMFFMEENINNFKYKLLYGKDEKIIPAILKNVSCENRNVLLIIDNFLSWCFEGNRPEKDILNGCRGMFSKHVLELTKKREWQLVERHLKWLFWTEYKIFKYQIKKLKCTSQMEINLSNEDIMFVDNTCHS